MLLWTKASNRIVGDRGVRVRVPGYDGSIASLVPEVDRSSEATVRVTIRVEGEPSVLSNFYWHPPVCILARGKLEEGDIFTTHASEMLAPGRGHVRAYARSFVAYGPGREGSMMPDSFAIRYLRDRVGR